MNPPNPPLRGVAFDLDGLLVNSEDVYIQVGAETLARRGKQFDDELRHEMMGRTAAAALQVMIDWHQLDDTVAGLVAESEELFWRFAAEDLRTMPALEDLLDWLDAQSIPRGIATSGGRGYAERVLGMMDLTKRFEFLITADDVQHGKPAPEPYLLAAQRLKIDPAAMLVLEDSSNGCKAGVAAGAYTVAVPNRHTDDHDFAGAALIANTLADPRIRQAFSIAS